MSSAMSRGEAWRRWRSLRMAISGIHSNSLRSSRRRVSTRVCRSPAIRVASSPIVVRRCWAASAQLRG